MLVLFTSYAALKKTAQAITGPLAREDIYVYEQGDGASPNALLESFKATERAVLARHTFLLGRRGCAR